MREGNRWGMIGTVLAALYGIAYIGGESSEPFNLWANQNNNGLEVFLWASFALAGGTVIEAVLEIVIRARNGWRLPAEKPA